MSDELLVSDDLLVKGMQGRLRKHEMLALVARLETESGAADTATSVPDDEFLLKIREHYKVNSGEMRMSDEQPRETMVLPDETPRHTVLVSDDEIRKIQAELRESAKDKQSSSKDWIEKPYAPTTRVPVIALVACDDGKDVGELFRIRGNQFLIGRTEGDLQVVHDEMISSRHVAITRQNYNGKHRAVITDLQSRNGMFVRVSKAPLLHNAEFFVGNGHYRVEIVQDIVPATAEMNGLADGPIHSTRLLEGHAMPGSVILSEMIHGKAETKIRLDKNEYSIGRNKSCEIRRSADPYAADIHARLKRSENGTWVLDSHKTHNGVWVRIPQITVEDSKSCEFRIGEQRMRLKVGMSKKS